jgi:hypothetical protein
LTSERDRQSSSLDLKAPQSVSWDVTPFCPGTDREQGLNLVDGTSRAPLSVKDYLDLSLEVALQINAGLVQLFTFGKQAIED